MNKLVGCKIKDGKEYCVTFDELVNWAWLRNVHPNKKQYIAAGGKVLTRFHELHATKLPFDEVAALAGYDYSIPNHKSRFRHKFLNPMKEIGLLKEEIRDGEHFITIDDTNSFENKLETVIEEWKKIQKKCK